MRDVAQFYRYAGWLKIAAVATVFHFEENVVQVFDFFVSCRAYAALDGFFSNGAKETLLFAPDMVLRVEVVADSYNIIIRNRKQFVLHKKTADQRLGIFNLLLHTVDPLSPT